MYLLELLLFPIGVFHSVVIVLNLKLLGATANAKQGVRNCFANHFQLPGLKGIRNIFVVRHKEGRGVGKAYTYTFSLYHDTHKSSIGIIAKSKAL